MRRCYDERHRVAELHNIIHKDFDVIRARHLEFDLAEKSHIRGAESGVLETEFDFALAQNRSLIWSNEADSFSEIADACRPAVEQAKSKRDNRDLWDADEVHHADEEEVSGDFLADFLAKEGALEVREDAGGVHF